MEQKDTNKIESKSTLQYKNWYIVPMKKIEI